METGVDSITPIAQDYLKAIWSATEWGGEPTTVKALAQRFGTTPAGVSDTIKRLTGLGLVAHQPYRAITLTEVGERLAIAMVRRHRLIEAFLVTSLGYRWDEVHDEAEALEHAASEMMIDRISALLGDPLCDPHGDPIPRPDGTVTYPVDALSLGAAPLGRYAITRISDVDPHRLGQFADLGLVPGALIDVTNSGDLLAPQGKVLAITPVDRKAIWVIPFAD